jgi:hypothetical protein
MYTLTCNDSKTKSSGRLWEPHWPILSTMACHCFFDLLHSSQMRVPLLRVQIRARNLSEGSVAKTTSSNSTSGVVVMDMVFELVIWWRRITCSSKDFLQWKSTSVWEPRLPCRSFFFTESSLFGHSTENVLRKISTLQHRETAFFSMHTQCTISRQAGKLSYVFTAPALR